MIDSFSRFMENLQIEILEVEFNEFSKSFNKLSEIDFAEILLRYTSFDDETKSKIIEKLESEIKNYDRVSWSIGPRMNSIETSHLILKEITFENFVQFSRLMNNLDDFALAIKYHTLANKSISKSNFLYSL